MSLSVFFTQIHMIFGGPHTKITVHIVSIFFHLPSAGTKMLLTSQSAHTGTHIHSRTHTQKAQLVNSFGVVKYK